MIVELPISYEHDVKKIGIESIVLVDVDSFEAICPDDDDEGSVLITKSGAEHPVRMKYEDLKRLWFKLISLKGKCDIVVYEEVDANDTPDGSCLCCGGMNFTDFIPGGAISVGIKKCMDCGVTQETK